MKAFRFVIRGYVPSKKNSYKPSRYGRLYIPTEVKAHLDSLEIQVKKQWGRRKPVEHPIITGRLFTSNTRRDRDNWLQTLQDIFVRAGVMVDDNIIHHNEWTHVAPACVVRKRGFVETSVIDLEWK